MQNHWLTVSMSRNRLLVWLNQERADTNGHVFDWLSLGRKVLEESSARRSNGNDVRGVLSWSDEWKPITVWRDGVYLVLMTESSWKHCDRILWCQGSHTLTGSSTDLSWFSDRSMHSVQDRHKVIVTTLPASTLISPPIPPKQHYSPSDLLQHPWPTPSIPK